jgi:hypothetical protein
MHGSHGILCLKGQSRARPWLFVVLSVAFELALFDKEGHALTRSARHFLFAGGYHFRYRFLARIAGKAPHRFRGLVDLDFLLVREVFDGNVLAEFLVMDLLRGHDGADGGLRIGGAGALDVFEVDGGAHRGQDGDDDEDGEDFHQGEAVAGLWFMLHSSYLRPIWPKTFDTGETPGSRKNSAIKEK